ncbi:GATA zinc finger domain-containing protein 14-like [Rana temporaria]|uniref:GATA zinc finger domain-containing protein 14-like n=1 Tax=Rana temporaria TaxID=8407 RepID=UPI001AAD4BA1|nr:GATA zinc finger domain-containing protein 14-like [Rana temporaria]
MTPPHVLRVSGIPAGHYDDDDNLLLDKLFIHFLRRKNGGNGEVDVRYPTRERGVAMLTFDQVEVVERVLSRRHLLEIKGLTFRLEVSRPQRQRTQFSMPITTNLSLAHFDDIKEVIALLKKHGLKVCGVENYYLSIEGDFQDLIRCRDELYKIMSNSAHHVENRMSRKDQYHAKEHSPDKRHVSGEEAGKQIPIQSLPDKSSNKTSNREPSPRRTKITPEPLPTDHDGHSSTGDGSRTPYIKPSLRSDGASQRRPKDTSSDDSTSIKKHPTINIAANLNLYPAPPKKLSAYEDRKISRSSPLPSNGKPADGSGLDGGTFASIQFRENLPESSSNQSKPKGTIADGITSNQKYPNSTIGDGSDFKPGQPKNTSTDEFNPKPSKSAIVDGTKFNSGEPKNASTEEFNSSQNHLKSANGDGTKFSSGQPKNASTDELNSNLKHSKSAIEEGTNKYTSGQPKNTSTAELNSTPNHSKRTIEGSTKFNSKQPKNKSTAESNSTPNHSKSTIGDSTRFNSEQPKNTSRDELMSNPNHSKNAIGDSTKFNSGQPKNTSTDKLNSNPNHSKSTIGDSTKFSSGQPKNSSLDELNLNPKLPKNALGDGANFKPGKPQNSPPDEFYLHPRDPEDLTARSSNRSSIMAAGWSSSSSPTFNSLTASNPKNRLDESSLSTELFVDPAAHTYVSVFMKDIIDDILGPSNAEIKIETGDGYNRVIMTSKSPHLSQNFYKAAHEISDVFTKCQHFLRVESIELSNISADVTKKLQTYLFYCGIWSSPNGKRLQMIGPSKDITRFMEKWASAGGDFVRLMRLLQGVSPASSRPPVVGRDNVHQSTTRNHNVTHDVHTQRARSRDRGEETGARGRDRRPDSISRRKKPSDEHWK